MQKFFSHGKLLLTSEYVVLDGALAWAIPTKLGQEMSVEEIADEKSVVFWEAFHEGKPWLQTKIDYKNWKIIDANLQKPAEFVLKTLQHLQELSEKRFRANETYYIKTNLQFPAHFGLGSSSTLMNNLANWAKIDAFELNEKALGGSGYDIAVAQKESAILYQLEGNQRKIQRIDFQPHFKDELIFIHLNQKQDSREGISMYRQKEKSSRLIQEFSELTTQIIQAQDIDDFFGLIEIHEQKLAQFLEISTAKEKFFPDCPVGIKSLGAWGGDFILSRTFEGYKNYFNKKGYTGIYNWEELIKI
jgi:mevalonate kinase